MLLVDSELPNFYRYAINDQFGLFLFQKTQKYPSTVAKTV